MAARSLRDTPEFRIGRRGERVVAAMYRELDYWILPAYDYAGPDGDRAPSLQALAGRLAVPDLDAARRGQRRWVEVKTKKAPSYYEIGREYVEGIDWAAYEGYHEVQRVTGVPVWLAFYELDTQRVIHQSLTHLATVVRHSTLARYGRGGMAYFPCSELLLLGTVEMDERGQVYFELASAP